MLKYGVMVVSIGLLSGCASLTDLSAVSTLPKQAVSKPASSQFLADNEKAVDALIENTTFLEKGSVLVATPVSVDKLGQSSSFGRFLGEQIGGVLAKKNVPVKEVKLRDKLKVTQEGELMLSRELKDLIKEAEIQAVLTSTYSATATHAVVSMKLVDPVSGLVLAGHSYSTDLSEVRYMLQSK